MSGRLRGRRLRFFLPALLTTARSRKKPKALIAFLARRSGGHPRRPRGTDGDGHEVTAANGEAAMSGDD